MQGHIHHTTTIKTGHTSRHGQVWLAILLPLVAVGIGLLVQFVRPLAREVVAPTAGQPAQAIQELSESAPAPDTTTYYLRAQEEQAVRDFWARALAPDTTAYYLRAQEEQAVRDFWARAVAPDTTAYYLRVQEDQAVRTLRKSHP